MTTLSNLFGRKRVFIGVVHLLSLPGSPGWQGDLDSVLAHARKDAIALEEGGADGIIVENFGDAPYTKQRVESHTVAAMTLAVQTVKDTVALPIGVNVLRNDVRAALAIAAVTDARFVRANVHYGVMASDEGVIEGEAYETVRYRHYLGVDVKIMADVLVKHATPMGSVDIALSAQAAVYRGLADAVIVTGPATGTAAAIDDVARVKAALPNTPVLVGSGVNESNVLSLLSAADGTIVGTSLKKDGWVYNPVEPERVKELAHRIRKLG